jgi:hypothetical protein
MNHWRVLATATALLAGVGCAPVLREAGAEEQARRQFSEEAFCPERRVVAERAIPVPAAPLAIASDPERLAMWQRTYSRRARGDPRQTIVLSGCGEQATYACWDYVGYGGRSRHGRKIEIYIGSSCNEAPRIREDGSSRSGSLSASVQDPAGGDVNHAGSTPSTTLAPQPKTSASSK